MSLLLLAAIAGGIPPGTPVFTEPPSSQCHWQRCGQEKGKVVNCESEEQGPRSDLVQVIRVTNAGAVIWKCKP